MMVYLDTSALLAVINADLRGEEAVLAAGRRSLSLVDCVSFAAMRQYGIREAFTFDCHFGEHGFSCLSS